MIHLRANSNLFNRGFGDRVSTVRLNIIGHPYQTYFRDLSVSILADD